MVKLEATGSFYLPSFIHFIIPSLLDLAGSCCISMLLCLRPSWGCFCFTKYCVFPNHTVSATINWLNEITLSLSVKQTRLSLSVLCPCNIFFFHLPLPQTFLLHSHLQILSSIVLRVPLYFRFPYTSVAFSHFHCLPSCRLSAGPLFLSVTLYPHLSPHTCVFVCGTWVLVVIFQAAAQKIGLS